MNELDASELKTDTDVRRNPRFKYHHHRCVLKLADHARIGGRSYRVSFRNVSEKGICCLHAGFIYTGTKCFVELLQVTGDRELVPGVVRRCGYVGLGQHEIGIEFDRAIEISRYVEAVDRIRVLVVDDDVDMRRLARHYVTALSADVVEARDGLEAIELISSERLDLTLMDLDMPKMDGFDAICSLRSRGYDGFIAAMTALTEPSVKERCLLAGADTIVTKPILRKTIEALFVSIGATPVQSEFRDEPSMSRRVGNFIGSIPGLIRLFEETYSASANKEYANLDHISGELRVNAASHGYPALSSMAGDLQLAIRFNLEKSAVKEALTDLVSECVRVWMGGRRIADF
ncbi:MAG TPA: response regulator [Phycisphaerae bacterium]|nr:response regulator [Phycisphaerae bacterium]